MSETIHCYWGRGGAVSEAVVVPDSKPVISEGQDHILQRVIPGPCPGCHLHGSKTNVPRLLSMGYEVGGIPRVADCRDYTAKDITPSTPLLT